MWLSMQDVSWTLFLKRLIKCSTRILTYKNNTSTVHTFFQNIMLLLFDLLSRMLYRNYFTPSLMVYYCQKWHPKLMWKSSCDSRFYHDSWWKIALSPLVVKYTIKNSSVIISLWENDHCENVIISTSIQGQSRLLLL